MEQLLKKVILAGIGVLSLTRDKVEELLEELVKRGEIESKEKSDILANLAKRGEEQKAEIEEKIKEIVDKTFSRIKIATKEDIHRLEEKLEKLEKKIK
jgi:polyhydroxyalkanoate synthesis regulator phasin